MPHPLCRLKDHQIGKADASLAVAVGGNGDFIGVLDDEIVRSRQLHQYVRNLGSCEMVASLQYRCKKG